MLQTSLGTLPSQGRSLVKLNATFEQKLASCASLQELEGFANRRRYDPSLPKWTDDERKAIIHRKVQMEKANAR